MEATYDQGFEDAMAEADEIVRLNVQLEEALESLTKINRKLRADVRHGHRMFAYACSVIIGLIAWIVFLLALR